MTPAALAAAVPLEPADWDAVSLVVFDIDGTLYDQRRLRIAMMRDLLLDAASRRRLDAIKILRAYRQIRERLAEREAPDCEAALIAETASATGHSPAAIRLIVEEWIERRPLPYLPACRYPGLVELFAGLRCNAKMIGILSDYPAGAKLAALGLDADYVVCATDKGIGLLKPNPRGLQAIIATAGVSPFETVLIGDRADRDGLAARRSGVWPLIRSARPIKNYQTFTAFDDAIFKRFLAS
jgi:FMN phosphatase YigB (HAD superfamily)